MTPFIVAAALLALLAVLFVTVPLLKGGFSAPPSATAALIAALGLIGISAVVYSVLGDPAGARLTAGGASGAAAANQDIAELARHVEQSPKDQSAWLSLGAAYGVDGQYPLALRAYERASELAGGNSAAALAGMGEAMLLGGDASQSAQASRFFERALKIDPQSAKALFYSALIAYRGGQLELARTRFAAVLNSNPPLPQNVRVALQKEIDQIDSELHPRVDAATAIHLHVSLAPALADKVPPNASLFVFVRSPEGGAPLAVKRANVKLPEDIDLSADDAMIAQHAVKPGQKVTVVARISASGSPLAQSGDLYGQIDYVAGKTGPRALEIDKLSR